MKYALLKFINKAKEMLSSMNNIFMKILGSLAAATLVGSILIGLDFWLHIPILISIVLLGAIILALFLILIFIEKRKEQNKR